MKYTYCLFEAMLSQHFCSRLKLDYLSPKMHGYPKLTLRVFLRGYTFTMVTTYGTKIITCSLMIEHLCHTITITVTDKEW